MKIHPGRNEPVTCFRKPAVAAIVITAKEGDRQTQRQFPRPEDPERQSLYPGAQGRLQVAVAGDAGKVAEIRQVHAGLGKVIGPHRKKRFVPDLDRRGAKVMEYGKVNEHSGYEQEKNGFGPHRMVQEVISTIFRLRIPAPLQTGALKRMQDSALGRFFGRNDLLHGA